MQLGQNDESAHDEAPQCEANGHSDDESRHKARSGVAFSLIRYEAAFASLGDLLCVCFVQDAGQLSCGELLPLDRRLSAPSVEGCCGGFGTHERVRSCRDVGIPGNVHLLDIGRTSGAREDFAKESFSAAGGIPVGSGNETSGKWELNRGVAPSNQ